MCENRSDHGHAESGKSEGEVYYAEMDQVEIITHGDTLCGIGIFKPACLQPFARMFIFIPTLTFSIIASYAYGFYIMSQVTTLEKQFGITSAQSGAMFAANDIGFLVTILLWSHFAKTMHKPRVLALTTFVFGMSALVSIVPHFLMVSQAGDMYETTGTSSAGAFDRRSLCLARNSTEHLDPSQISAKSERIRYTAYSIMFISFGLMGIVRAPRNPLTQTYIDDNVPKTQTGVYMGVTAGLTTLGPVFGSIIGGVFSRIYVTLEDTDLTTHDPRFIGAWWLGFLLFASMALIAAIPLSLFPRRMPHAPGQQTLIQENSTSVTNGRVMVEELSARRAGGLKLKKTKWQRFVSLVIALFPSMLRLVKNPLYVLLITVDSAMFLTVAGRITFYPKYLQQHFRIPTSRSNFFFGVTMVLPYALGMLCGGVTTNRLKLTIRGCAVLRWVTDGMSAVMMFLALLVVCDQPIIHGLSNPSDALKLVTPAVINMTCDTDCMCEDEDFLPSCGADNRNYFSPCHAGCKTVLPNRDFGNCSCIPESASYNQTVTPRYCEGQCNTIYFYFVLSAAGSFCSALNSIPSNLVSLRSVEERDRSISIGAAGLLRSLLGFISGPVIFGLVVDTACILWSDTGSCSLYDIDDLRIKLHGFAGSVLAAVIVANGVIVVLTFKMSRYCKIAEWQRRGFEQEAAVSKRKEREKKHRNGGDSDVNEYQTMVDK